MAGRPVPLSTSQLEKIAEEHGTPFQLYDEKLIRENAQQLLKAFKTHFPEFREYFAVKALPNPSILKILLSEGCGLDCSSVAELHIAEKLGCPPDMVMYTSNFTSQKDLGIAFDQGVILNLDDISLVDSLIATRGRCPELISFRLNPGLGRTDSETSSNVLGGPDAKFGVPPFQIIEAYRKAQAAGSTRFGIHMMTGSCVMNDEYWQDTVHVLLKTLTQLKDELGISCEFMNIGGGLGIPYKPGQEVVDVATLAGKLRATIDTQVAAAAAATPGFTCPRLCMENGRYMTGPFGWLVARCVSVKDTYARYYGLDACMSNLMRPGMYGAYHHITVPAREAEAEAEGGGGRTEVNVVGQLCENNDWFARSRPLPKASQLGDLFVMHDSGAHCHSMGFQYNGKLRAPELLIRGKPDSSSSSSSSSSDGAGPAVSLIRARETIESLYALCPDVADLE